MGRSRGSRGEVQEHIQGAGHIHSLFSKNEKHCTVRGVAGRLSTSRHFLARTEMRSMTRRIHSLIRSFASVADEGVSEKSASDMLSMLCSHDANPAEGFFDSISSHSPKERRRSNRARAVWSESHLDPIAKGQETQERPTWGSWGNLTELDVSTHVQEPAVAPRNDPTSEFAPVRTMSLARYELRWNIESLLRQRGYKNQSPGSPSSIALLSRKALDALALDCGLDRTKSLNHHQMAEVLSSIVLEDGQEVELPLSGPLENSVIDQGASAMADLSTLPLEEKIGSWLIESHCRNVRVISTTHSSFVILATADSQRQAHASGFGVKSRARREIDKSFSSPQLIGSRGMDWVSVFIDRPDTSIGVHILTERARAFYNLEELVIDKDIT